MKSIETIKYILAAIISGAWFAIMVLFLDLNILFSIVLCVGFFTGLLLLISSGKKKSKINTEDIECCKTLLKESYGILDDIESVRKKIKIPKIQTQTVRITDSVVKNLNHVEKFPEKARICRNMLLHYLNSTLTILMKYEDIVSYSANSTTVRDALLKIETMLDTIEKALNNQLDKLLKTDISSLESELNALEALVDMEEL